MNEVVILAAVMVSESIAAKYLPTISADYFYAPGHAEAWSCLQELRRRGLSYDPATVSQLSGGKVDASVLEEYVRARPEPPPNIKHHVEALRWDRARVEASKGPIPAFLESLRDPGADPERVRALARKVAQAFDGHGSGRYLRSSSAVTAEHSRVLTRRREGEATYPYGFRALDFYGPDDFVERDGVRRSLDGEPRIIPGAAPGQVTVVCGVSRSGKTTATARSVLHFGNTGRRVLWGAWEQQPGPSLELLAAMQLGWSRTDLLLGRYSAEEQAELEATMASFDGKISLFDLPFGRARGEYERRGHLNDRNLDTIHQHVADSGCDVFIADLFSLALEETRPEDEMRAIYRLKAIAIEEQTHIIAIHQLRLKDVEQRVDKRPTLESVKGSSGWVEAADTLFAWYRESLYKPSIPDTKIECHLLKQRHGVGPQVVEMDWDPEFMTIEGGRTIAAVAEGAGGDGMDGFLETPMIPRRRRRRH